MKRYLYILIATIIAVPLALFSPDMARVARAEKKYAPADKANETVVSNDWSHYSWGIYYKNLALRERNNTERETYLKKAIQNLKEAGL